MPYAIVSNNTSGPHGNLKGSKLVNLSAECKCTLSVKWVKGTQAVNPKVHLDRLRVKCTQVVK